MDHRNTILTLAAVLTTGLVGQSPFEFADQRTHQVGFEGVERIGGRWVGCVNSGHESGGGVIHAAVGYHADGSLAWETPLTGGSWPGIPADLLELPGDRVLIAGPVDGCDVGVPVSFYQCVDASGFVLASAEIQFDGASRLDIDTNDRILLSCINALLEMNTSGVLLDTIGMDTLLLPSPLWAVWDGDSAVMMLRYNDQLERRDLQANVLAVTTWPSGIQDVINWNGTRLMLDQIGSVHLLDDALDVIGTTPLGTTYPFGRFVRDDGTLWVVGNEQAAELDGTLAILQIVELDPDGVFDDSVFRSFAVDGDTLAMAGTALTASRPAGILRTVLADGSMPEHDEDVSIIMESVDTVWYDIMSSIVFPRVTATVRLTNEGTGIVDNVVVNHWLPYAGICSMVGKTLHLEDLNLAPGASVTAEMDSLWLNYAPWGFVNLDQQFCIAALSPNAIYDRDQIDNLACDTAHIVLGIAEVTAATQPFTLINDPTGPVLWFHEAPRAALQLRLLDSPGRVLLQDLVAPGTERYAINVSGLAAGVLCIEVSDARSGRWVVKWVME